MRIRKKGRAGQALVEMAIALPVLVLLLVGIMEMASAWRHHQVITHATREGARMSALPTADDEMVGARIREVIAGASLPAESAEIALSTRRGTGTMDTILVRYPVEFRMLSPLVRAIQAGDGRDIPGSLMISSQMVIRNE